MNSFCLSIARRGRLVALLSALLSGLLCCGLAQSALADDYAIVGGKVHTLIDAAPLESATVLVSDGVINAVGADLDVPSGFTIIDATGRVVTPGLIESHSQLGLVEIGGEVTTVDSQVKEFPSGAAFDVRYALNDASTAIAINRRDGITRAVVAPRPANDPLAGWGVVIRLTDREMLVQLETGMFGAIGSASSSFVGGSRSAVIQRLRRGFELAPRYSMTRYQPGPGDYSHQDLAALKEFMRSDRPLVLDVHRANEIRQAVQLADDYDLRLIVLGGSEAWQVADLLAARRVPVIVNVLANLPISYDRLGARLDNAALLHAAGVPLLLTAGGTENVRLLRQMAGNAVANGLPWHEALAAMTRSPAEIWGMASGLGTLSAGAPADLVIWTGDPLELTNWAERVMIDGQWQDMSSRQTRLFERYRDVGDEDRYYR